MAALRICAESSSIAENPKGVTADVSNKRWLNSRQSRYRFTPRLWNVLHDNVNVFSVWRRKEKL